MVDSVGKIGAQNIDWYKLTIKEVQKYETEGVADDIPNEVKKWVEEMAKVANAPDNVTYEMSNGEVTTENQDEQAVGASQLEQAIALGEQSDLAADEVESLMSEIETWTATAVDANDKAQQEYESAMSKINALVAERASAASGGDKAKVASLDEQLAGAGRTVQGTIGTYSSQVASIQSNLSGITATANEAVNLGTQAVQVAGLEKENSDMVQDVISKGTKAIAVGSNGLSVASGPEMEVSNFGQNIRAYISDVQTATAVTGSEDTNKKDMKEEEETSTDKKDSTLESDTRTAGQNSSTADKTSTQDNGTNSEDFTLANKDITTDPTEMLKRKERKGQV